MANLYDSIPALTGFLADPGRNAIGAMGERLAALLLEQNGYTVSFTRPNQRRGDLRVVDTDGVVQRVEVKTARRHRDNKWRFLLWKRNEQNYRDADFLILLPVLPTGDVVPYVIPVAEIGQRSQIRITSHPRTYTGIWSVYRQLPGELTLGVCRVQVQMVPAQAAGIPASRPQPGNRKNSCGVGTRAASNPTPV